MKSQPPSFGKSPPESQLKAEVSQGKSRPPVLTEQSFQIGNRASTKQGAPSFSKKSDQSTGFGKTSDSKRPPELPRFVENSKVKITEGPSTSIKPNQSGDTELRSVPKGLDFEPATKIDQHPTVSPLSQPTASILAKPNSVVGIEKPEPLKRGNQSPLDEKPSVEESVDMTEFPTQFESSQTQQNRSVATNFKLAEDASVAVLLVLNGQENKNLPGKTNLSLDPDLEGIPKASDKGGCTCPKCEAVLKPGVKICVACGFNLANGDGKTKPEVESPLPALERPLPPKPVVEEKGPQDTLKPAPAPIPEVADLHGKPDKVRGELPGEFVPANLVIKGATTSLSSEVAPTREGGKPISEQLAPQIESESWKTPVTELVIEPLKTATTELIQQVGTESLQKLTSNKSKLKRSVALVGGIALAGVVTAWLWGSRHSSTAAPPYVAPAAQVPISAPEVDPATIPSPAPAPVGPQPAAKPAEPAPSLIPAPLAPVAKPEPKVPATAKTEPVANPSAKPSPPKTVPRKELNERDKQLLDKANKTLDDLLK